MNNEKLIRNLIQGSIHRAVQETVAALIVLVAFVAILVKCNVGSPRYFGCLLILMGTGFIIGVVWSFALSFAMLVFLWAVHNGFFRRYGLNDTYTVLVNSVFLFLVLFYVYPLKFMSTALSYL